MAYFYVKAVCLFCDETIEGATERMNAAKNFKYDDDEITWLEKVPENDWAYRENCNTTANGSHRGARFYLCPQHQTSSHWTRALKWLNGYANRDVVINANIYL